MPSARAKWLLSSWPAHTSDMELNVSFYVALSDHLPSVVGKLYLRFLLGD